MRLTRMGIVFLPLFFVLPAAGGFANAAPQMAIALVEGRSYDQAHDTGYIDWSGPVGYVFVTHRDFTSLPPEEGGGSCASGCQEWVTRIGNGGTASGSFERDVSYFEVMVEFTHDSSVGSATVRACSSVSTANLYLGSGGGLPGFVSLSLTVPAGCRSWSLSASGGYVDFRSVDVNYVVVPPTATFTPSRTPTTTLTFASPTATLTATPTITNTPTLTSTPTFTPTNTPTMTVTSTYTITSSPTPAQTNTLTPTFTSTATVTAKPPRVSIPDRWWIWEAGGLKVSHGSDLLANVKVTISDPLKRWRPMVMEYDPEEIPDSIAWDRRFADGTPAPSGEYPIVVRACDSRGLCGQDKGVIVIPIAETRTPTMTTSPTTTITLVPSVTSAPTHALPTQTPTLPAMMPVVISDPGHSSFPLWQILGLLGLFMVIASASLTDSRPGAIQRLGNTFSLISSNASDDSFENKIEFQKRR